MVAQAVSLQSDLVWELFFPLLNVFQGIASDAMAVVDISVCDGHTSSKAEPVGANATDTAKPLAFNSSRIWLLLGQ